MPPEILQQTTLQLLEDCPDMTAMCAIVSHDWQVHVEIRSFALLRLNHSRVGNLGEVLTPELLRP